MSIKALKDSELLDAMENEHQISNFNRDYSKSSNLVKDRNYPLTQRNDYLPDIHDRNLMNKSHESTQTNFALIEEETPDDINESSDSK